MRRSAPFLLALALGCSAPKTGLPIRVGTDVDASSLDPRLMRDTTSYRVVDLLFDGLVRLDRNLVPVPGLAVSWENPEPTRWVFHLRENARFHDGRPFVAEDVVHTLETILDPSFGAPLRSLYEPIERVIAIGESQSAGFLVTYVNAVDPVARCFDAFLIHGRPGAVPSMDGAYLRAPSNGDLSNVTAIASSSPARNALS